MNTLKKPVLPHVGTDPSTHLPDQVLPSEVPNARPPEVPSSAPFHSTGANTCAPEQFPKIEPLVHEEIRYGPVRSRDDVAPPGCGCGHSEEICDCGCHDPEKHTEHVGPCCRNCPNCGKRIKWGFLELHMQSCRAENRVLLPAEPMYPIAGHSLGQGGDDGPG